MTASLLRCLARRVVSSTRRASCYIRIVSHREHLVNTQFHGYLDRSHACERIIYTTCGTMLAGGDAMAERPDILNMRLDPTTRAVIDALGDRFGLNRSAVVRQAVRRWAHAEGVEIPQEPEQGKAAA